ncbi:MAG: phenylalanine--tRNA ligase subunit alpha, partial [Thioalkalispiraceae bacterium]
MEKELAKLVKEAEDAVKAAADLQALDQVRVNYLGKKGSITAQMKNLGKLSAEERPKAGQVINQAKQAVQASIEAKKTALEDAKLNEQLASETIDVTLPGRAHGMGGLHPV